MSRIESKLLYWFCFKKNINEFSSAHLATKDNIVHFVSTSRHQARHFRILQFAFYINLYWAIGHFGKPERHDDKMWEKSNLDVKTTVVSVVYIQSFDEMLRVLFRHFRNVQMCARCRWRWSITVGYKYSKC